MARPRRMAALIMAVMIVLSGLALAQRYDDDDDGGHYSGSVDQARQYGYQNGYRDGMNRGREEGRENDPFDYRTPDWRQATRGYQSWMGPVGWFQQGYQQGYRSGFENGYQSVNRWRGDGDGDDGYRHGGEYGYRNPAYNVGYQDGASMARQDIEHHRNFNPKPRGPYDDKDHGYRREYGDKNGYKAQYNNGYRAGYEATFHGRYARY